jgi:hypothetical protein
LNQIWRCDLSNKWAERYPSETDLTHIPCGVLQHQVIQGNSWRLGRVRTVISYFTALAAAGPASVTVGEEATAIASPSNAFQCSSAPRSASQRAPCTSSSGFRSACAPHLASLRSRTIVQWSAQKSWHASGAVRTPQCPLRDTVSLRQVGLACSVFVSTPTSRDVGTSIRLAKP